MRYSELQQELMSSQDKHRQGLQELSIKEEDTVVFKVELSSLQEKFKYKIDEVTITLILGGGGSVGSGVLVSHWIKCLTSVFGFPYTACVWDKNISFGFLKY